MLRRRVLSVFVLLLIPLSACTQPAVVPGEATDSAVDSPSPTPLAPVTSSALPTVSFSMTPVEGSDVPTGVPPSSTASIPATATPTAAVLPANFSPVLLGKKYDANTFFTLLGGVQGGAWLSADQAAASIPGASPYDVYTLGSGPHLVYGYAPEKSMIHADYFLGTDAALNETGMIGVAPGWQVTHGVAEELPANNDLYRQVVLDFLSDAGVVDPQIGTMHIYRIDLESDGSDEILITDTRVESAHTVAAGDHSIVLMRKVSGSGVVTIPILVDLYAAIGYGNPFPCSYSVANFIDLNQDGVLEVVVSYDRWEGFGASVHQVHADSAEQVLGSTCIGP